MCPFIPIFSLALFWTHRLNVTAGNKIKQRWSHWSRCLKRGSKAARWLELWVQILQETWKSLPCNCCVLLGSLWDGPITRLGSPTKSSVSEWSRSLIDEVRSRHTAAGELWQKYESEHIANRALFNWLVKRIQQSPPWEKENAICGTQIITLSFTDTRHVSLSSARVKICFSRISFQKL